jgi:hypothetical protein
VRGGLEFLRFNAGLVSEYLIARLDLRKLAVSAVEMTNWMLRSVGYMFLRPGMQYIGGIASGTAGRQIAFIKSVTDTAIIELSTSAMRVSINDVLLTYPTVSTSVANSGFSGAGSWTDMDEAGGTSSIGSGTLDLVSNGTALAIREQTLTIAAGDQGVEHCLSIRVLRGPVTFQVGSTSGGDDYVSSSSLGVGDHMLAFTPSGASAYVRFSSTFQRIIRVDFCTVATGVMSITTPWSSQAAMRSLRYDQSGDVIFIASANTTGVALHQRKIERRGTGRSWSLVAYAPEDGPFLTENLTPTTITASALTGNVTLTASRSLFSINHEPPDKGVGALFSISSQGQNVEASITAENNFSDAIEVTGVDAARAFSIIITGTFVATVTLQRSVDSSAGPWTDVTGAGPWTAPVSTTFDDTLDNQIIWYRIGIKTGGFTSGTAAVRLTITSGSVRGIARITQISSATSASAEVLKALGATTATDVWQEGSWSTKRGYPSATHFHGLKLWWAGKGSVWGSVSDAFASFDETFEGDAGPINRNLTSGPVDAVSWIASLRRLIFGAQGAEVSVITSALDEPITPTNFDPRRTSGQGSGGVQAADGDDSVYFVNRSGMKVFLLSPDASGFNYSPFDVLKYCPEVGYPGIVGIAIARQPETMIFVLRSDGKCVVLTRDAEEQLNSLNLIETDGTIIDVLVMPAQAGQLDDNVHFMVTRNINGTDVTYREKLAQQVECRGGVLNKVCDSFVYYSGAATTTITGLGHLNGEEVVVWANGARVSTGHGDDQITYTVSSGQITGLPVSATTACVGKAYRARWKSTKLAYLAANGKSALGARKKVDNMGLVLAATERGSLRFGPTFDTMDPMPDVEFAEENPSANIDALEGDMMPFPRDDWTTDARSCIEADAPGHAHLLAMTLDLESNK